MENYLDQAPCLFFATSDDGILLDVNERLCSELGYSREDLIGKKSDLLFTIATRIFQQTHFFPLLKMQNHAEEIFISLKRSDGEELPVLINARRKEVNGQMVNLHSGIIVHNRQRFEQELISAKKAAEAALNENTTLIQAQLELQRHSEELDRQIFLVNKQNEELKQFNRVATHDMQEPLRKLSVFLNMLIEDRSQQEQKTLISKLRKVTEQMKEILAGLQQYVWLNETPVTISQVGLKEIILSAHAQLQEEFPQVELAIEIEGIPLFYGDPEQVAVLFYQLLSNVIRFRKDEGRASVKISFDTVRLNQFKNTEGRYKYIDHYRIRVKDEGIGLESEYKSQAFELFRRLHVNGGRGVGLALCKKIVDNHHGTISIDGAPGEGAAVTILIPLNGEKENEINTTQTLKEIHE